MIIDITNDFSIDIGNGTDVGKVRQKNEDYLESFESSFGYVFVVCDGMGGHTAGEVASRLAVATIKENVLNNPQGITSTKQIIIDSLNLANHRIIEKWTDEPELKGMGTTAVVLIVKSNIAYYAHVGDSRMYMVRNKKIYQLTRDHSFVQTLVDGGLISYEEAETHPRKNEIMQALGITTEIKVDINNIGLNLYKTDTFILCSDGLSGLMKDEEIQRIVNTNDPQEASLKLISTANNNGGFDNITVQVVKVVKGLSAPKGKEDAVPLGALDKKVTSIKQNTFKPHSFDKTMELPAFNNIQTKKKNKTMLYVLLVALILIFSGLSYYKIVNDKPKTEEAKEEKKSAKNDTIVISDLKIILSGLLTDGNYDTIKVINDYDFSGFVFKSDLRLNNDRISDLKMLQILFKKDLNINDIYEYAEKTYNIKNNNKTYKFIVRNLAKEYLLEIELNSKANKYIISNISLKLLLDKELQNSQNKTDKTDKEKSKNPITKKKEVKKEEPKKEEQKTNEKKTDEKKKTGVR